MTSSLLSIAASGAQAAEIALNLTAQNVANASTQGYVRRSANNLELASASSWSTANDISLSGVVVSGITRNADAFLQAEARRTASDTARADTTVAGLTNVETAIETSGLFTTIGDFTNALTTLGQNPTDNSLRAGVIGQAQTMVSAFQIAGQSLSAAQAGMQTTVAQGVGQVNTLATQLATINTQLSYSAGASSAVSDGTSGVTSSDRASLMDQRDSLLDQIGQLANVTTTLQVDGTANVTLGGISGPPLVTGSSSNPVTNTVNADGTETLKVGNVAVSLSGGSIAGNQAALIKLNQISGNLDSLAAGLASAVNTQQTHGADLAGNPGAALFAGTTAATLTLATTSGGAIATAASGSPAKSVDMTNLTALNASLVALDPAGTISNVLSDISGSVQSAKTTQTTLHTLSGAAATSLSAQSGVDLNAEAVNLVKFQQAFQASGKVMQVASDIFTSILNLH